jgi:hypothetical protein
MDSRDTEAEPHEQKSNEPREIALAQLSKIVSQVMQDVQEIYDTVLDRYDELGLSSLSAHFEAISAQFSNYTVIRNQIHYVVHKSKDRLKATQDVAAQAGNIAKMFEKYARRPNTYSRVESRLAINLLVGKLTNLKALCTKI